MGTFVALDVAIGLTFMYLLLAIVCSAINEWIASAFRLRARTLKTAVARLVDAPTNTAATARGARTPRLSDQLFNHPLILSVKDGTRNPSYIAAPRFVAALKDTLAADTTRTPSPGMAEKNTPAGDLDHVKAQLSALAKIAPRRLQKAEATQNAVPAGDQDLPIEAWFNEAMDRASGWYKRKLMLITIVVAAAITVASNADTISAAGILWRDPTVRAAVVAQAQARSKRPRPSEKAAVVQADYPNKDKPISTDAAGELEEDNPEDANTAGNDVEPTRPDTGLTDDERAALGQIVGWGRDFKTVNARICDERQARINEACKVEAKTSAECTKAIDGGTAAGVCVQGGNGLESTDVFSGFAGVFPTLGSHLLGWFLTTVAVSMGAPFWFDTLKTFMNVRGSGKTSDEKD